LEGLEETWGVRREKNRRVLIMGCVLYMGWNVPFNSEAISSLNSWKIIKKAALVYHDFIENTNLSRNHFHDENFILFSFSYSAFIVSTYNYFSSITFLLL
jgi:hypothetical protein